MKTVFREIFEWIAVFLASFLAVAFLNTMIYATTQVRQSSMQDTLFEGQHLLVEKFSYLLGEPSRGDIVVFLENNRQDGIIDRLKIFLTDVSEILKPVEQKTNIRLVKRIIGIPGDTIDIKGGIVILNGTELNEPYANGITFPREMDFPVTVPPGKYFVMGDNREVSKDSRTFGFIDCAQIEGRAVFIFWPPADAGALR